MMLVQSKTCSKIYISDGHLMAANKPLLGEILEEAALVSPAQVSLVIQEQKYYPDYKIGELLALRGWISQKTADFFAEQWTKIQIEKMRQPLGYYLKEAGLLNDEQISLILSEQNKLWLRFGSVAVLKGWLKEETLKFFLYYLCPQNALKSVTRDKLTQEQSFIDNTKIVSSSILENRIKSTQEYESTQKHLQEIAWIG
jgi:hypothetical protein